MSRWTIQTAEAWQKKQPWRVGCNFIPSTAVNQLECWQGETYDPATIDRELSWAEDLRFNALRVFLHDLVWWKDRDGFLRRIDDFLTRAARHHMAVMLVFFDDCHRPEPAAGPQPLPVRGVHNSGWVQSPGQSIVRQFASGSVPIETRRRLEHYVKDVLRHFSHDERVWVWDLYNEPGRSGNGELSLELLRHVWDWAWEIRPSQPLTACLEGAVGNANIEFNREHSDVLTFHVYDREVFDRVIDQQLTQAGGRPIICTEFMAREHGTTFEYCLPKFKSLRMDCLCWGLVAGKTQTHFNWKTVECLETLRAAGQLLQPDDPVPEPAVWHHDIFRSDGTPYDPQEVEFIRRITGVSRI